MASSPTSSPSGSTASNASTGAIRPRSGGGTARSAARHGLAVTGGSDYHGENKPDLRVGTGRGDLAVPDELLGELEARRP